MDDLNFKEILIRKPYYEVLPKVNHSYRTIFSGQNINEPTDRLTLKIKTQADFMREYYPSAHKINDHILFPDVYKKDPDTGKMYLQPVTRCAFSFQITIKTKQVIELVGNDVQFELSDKSDNDKVESDNNSILQSFRKGWLSKNMEIRMYEAIDAIKTVGDAAIVGYFDNNNKFGTRTFSYLNGDTLYPHHDSITGKLDLFARRYTDMDEDGNLSTEYVEVWDEKYIYKCKRGISSIGVVQKIKEVFGLGGYIIVSQTIHGFNFVPVAYHRNEIGACWTPAQKTIEDFEESFSYFRESNKAFGNPILKIVGEGVDVQGDMNGAVKAITISDPDGDAGFLSQQTSNNPLEELKMLYKLIYEQSFAVQPPEVKSGDLPGVAIKLLYAPAIEQAIHDTHQLQDFLDDVVYMVKYGYGYEMNIQASMINLDINSWIEPYVPQNDSELMQNLAIGVQNEFLSHRTASERIPKYAKNDEIDRIIREQKQAQQMDLLTELNNSKNDNPAAN